MDTQQEKVLRLLEDAGGKLLADDDIVFSDDNTLSIPKTMTLNTAWKFIRSKEQEQEENTSFSRSYMFRPWDGASATYRALKRVFGIVRLSGSGWNPPQMVTINVGVNETAEVPWGSMTIPILPETQFIVDSDYDSNVGQVFVLKAFGPRKDRHAIQGVFNIVEDELKRESIYRGKAFDGQPSPEFIDVSSVDRSRIVYTNETADQMLANVWSLLRWPDAHRVNGLPLKRAVLLAGPYGTGKTVGATITAQEATANGWTFVYCRPGRDDLSTCMATAKLYQPSVLFVEDVDVVSDPETTGIDGIARLLDLFDGMTNKQTEMLVVMTTNHPETIQQGMMRPGRIDSVIPIGALDRESTERMVRVLINPNNLAPTVDFDSVYEAMDGFLPAYIKESVDRAQRYNLARNDGMLTVIDTDDLVMSANGLRPQLELMNGAKERKTVDPLSNAFGAVIDSSVVESTGPMFDKAMQEANNNFGLVTEMVSETPYLVKQRLDGMAILDMESDNVSHRLDADY